MSADHTPTALITGASRGLGLALARDLAGDGWRIVATARGEEALAAATRGLPDVRALPGDVADPDHRRRLVEAADGRLDLLVNNASSLGPSPLPRLSDVDLAALRDVLEVNVVAPLGLVQLALPALRAAGGVIIDISSDAALGDWEGWGVYGASKAALDRLSAVLGAELGEIAVYAVDPGDMRTQMHADAFPGEDISDRPGPESVVPALRRLLGTHPPSGRYLAADLLTVIGGVAS